MALHAKQAVSHFHTTHADALRLIQGYLDMAVSEAYSRWTDKYEPKDLHGSVLAVSVRNLLLSAADNPPMRKSTLTMSQGPNCSAHLFDPEGNRIRVRKRPLGLKTMTPLGVTPAPVLTLLGVDLSAAPYELAVLWTPDLKTQALGSASLAAVAHLDDAHRTAIYADLALPLASGMPANPPKKTNEELLDDFDDLLDDEQDTGDSPA